LLLRGRRLDIAPGKVGSRRKLSLLPTDLSFKAYAAALKSKQLLILKRGLFEAHAKPNIYISLAALIDFSRQTLCV
jgi:hypothetical protein